MKQFTSKTQKIGEIGEKIAEMFLVKHGFTIIDRNFTHKLGEIDIIAKKNNKIFFFEVKTVVNKNNNAHPITVTRETLFNNVSRVTNIDIRQNLLKNARETSVKHIKSRIESNKRHESDTQNVSDVYQKDVSRETNTQTYNPFQNMSFSKMRKFSKVVQIYLSKRHVSRETKYQIDGLGVVLTKNSETGKITGKVTRLENVNIK